MKIEGTPETEPTDEGRRRYPDEPVGYYAPDYQLDGSRHACTCKPTCPRPCKGLCGCEACHTGYHDDLSYD